MVRSALVVTALIATSGAIQAQTPRVSVVVHNRSRLLAHTVADAQQIVDRVFIDAGVQLVWRPRRRASSSAAFEEQIIRIMIIAREAALAIGSRRDALGFTPGSKAGNAWLAYVLADRVSDVSRGYSVRPAVVLASVIAHEMGHMLVSGRHSPAGLMRTQFNQADFRKIAAGDLRFTEREAADLRARIAALNDPPRAVEAFRR